MNKRLIILLEVSLIIISIVILALSIFFLPYAANKSAENFPEVAHLQYPILIGIYLTCIPFYMSIYQSFRIIGFVKKGNLFAEHTCKSLRIITLSAVSIIMFYVIGMIYLNLEQALQPTLMLLGLIIMFTSLVIAGFAEVLKTQLIKVVDVKNENDLTI